MSADAKPFKVLVNVCGTAAGAYEFTTAAEAIADKQSREPLNRVGCYYRLDGPCPKCMGEPQHPEIGCPGCMACDFTGTLEGFDEATRLQGVPVEEWDDSHLT